jgi:hypothetical protein
MGPADWGEAAPALIEREEFMAALSAAAKDRLKTSLKQSRS